MILTNIYIALFIFCLLILIIESARFLSIYIKTGTVSPTNLFLMGLFNYDRLLGYNLEKDFTTKTIWKNSENKRKNIDRYLTGMGREVTINEKQYRGKVCSVKKSKDTIRIVAIGESTTFGAFNDDSYTWPQLLEEELNNKYKDKCFEVMNLGVRGYKLHQCVQRYLRDYIEYDVNIILTACCFNDYKYFHSDEKFGRMGLDKYNNDIKKYYSKSNMMHYMSYFWNKSITRRFIFSMLNFFVKLSPRHQEKTRTERNYGDFSINMDYYKTFYTSERYWVNNYIKWYDELYTEMKKHHPKAKHAFVCLPVLMSDNKFYENSKNYKLPELLSLKLISPRGYDSNKPGLVDHHAKYLAHTLLFEKMLKKLSKKYNDSDVLSTYSSFSKIPFKDRIKHFITEIHLTNDGNLILAKELSNVIGEKYL